MGNNPSLSFGSPADSNGLGVIRRSPLFALLDASPQAYAQSWPVFRSRSNQRGVMIEWWDRKAESIVKGRQSVSVLSVGCGNGSLDSELLASLSHFAPTVRFSGCEPNRTLAGTCRSTIPKRFQPAVTECTWEAYKADQQYDVVLLSHCLYYMPEQAAAVQKALDCRSPGGDLIIFNATERGLAEVRGALTTRLTGIPYKYFTSNDLNAVMAPRSISQERLASEINVSKFSGDGVSDDPLLLSFLTDCDLRSADPSTIEVVRKSIHGFTKERGDSVVLEHPVVAFWDSAA